MEGHEAMGRAGNRPGTEREFEIRTAKRRWLNGEPLLLGRR